MQDAIKSREYLEDWLRTNCDRGMWDKYEIECEGGTEYFVTFTEYDKSALFRVKQDDHDESFYSFTIEINVYEDVWEDCDTDSGPFWYTVLDWPEC